MVVSTCPCNRLRLQRHHLEEVVQVTAARNGIEPLHQFRILRRDTRRVLALMPVVIGASGGAERVILGLPARIVVAQRDHGSGADGNRIRAQGKCLGHISAAADTAGDDQLNFAVQVHVLKRANRLADAGDDRQTDMLDEHVLRGGGAALHAVQNDHIRTGLDRQHGVKVGTGAPDLDVDRLFPRGNFAQFHDLDLKIVGAGPVRVAAGATLVDTFGQVAHLRNAVGDLLTQQHAAAARLGALANHDFDRIAATQVIGVHAVTRGQDLIDQLAGMAALFFGHAAVAGGGRRARHGGTATQGFLGRTRKRAKGHACDRDRNVQLDRLLGKPGAQSHLGVALLAVAFEGIAGNRRTEEQQVVKMRDLALGAATADVIDARRGRAADFRIRRVRERGRLDRNGARCAFVIVFHIAPLVCVVDVEVIQLARGPVALELFGLGVAAAALQQFLEDLDMLGTHFLFDAVGTQRFDRAAHEQARLVDAVAQRVACIAADNEVAGLGHEGAHMADIAVHDDVDALHRDTAARAGVTLDDQRAAIGGGAGVLAGITFNDDGAAHHVLGDTGAGRTVHMHGGLLVHAGAVIAGRAFDVHLDRGVQTDSDRVTAPGIHDFPRGLVRLCGLRLKRSVQIAQALRFKIESLHYAAFSVAVGAWSWLQK